MEFRAGGEVSKRSSYAVLSDGTGPSPRLDFWVGKRHQLSVLQPEGEKGDSLTPLNTFPPTPIPAGSLQPEARKVKYFCGIST